MVSSGMRLRIEIISYSLLIREIQVQRYTIFTELRKKVCILEIIRIFANGFGQGHRAESIEALYFFL